MADVEQLTLIHLNPQLADLSILIEDATSVFDRVSLEVDEMTLADRGLR